jgi:hypothetical protein
LEVSENAFSGWLEESEPRNSTERCLVELGVITGEFGEISQGR